MKVAAINSARLNELCTTLRRSDLPRKQKLDMLETLLKACDILSITDTEYLMCTSCAAELRNVERPTIHRMCEEGRLTTFRLCHKDYVDRREIEGLPPTTKIKRPRLGAKHDYRSRPLEEHDLSTEPLEPT